ncbi:MAG: hypothetical protein ACE5HS_12220 [bacterium]
MQKYLICLLFFLMILIELAACQSRVAIEDISRLPQVIELDKRFADVFRMLDGTWEGRFFIYTVNNGQAAAPAQPESISLESFSKLDLQLQNVIQVQQKYASESPYFQRVWIRDMMVNQAGETQVIESQGVNKVQNGALWCVVIKPDEKVIHTGKLVDEHTIIWRREVRTPQRIEYFRETVIGDKYTILGWGYYGEDDPNLAPKYWFRGEYLKKTEATSDKKLYQ